MADAIERTLALIDPVKRPNQPKTTDGYLDLLGDEAAAGAHPGQQLMESPGLARIYERLWRPVLGRVLMGAFGPTARDEQRIAQEMLSLTPGEKVLDVGCGPGNFTREFARTVGDEGLAVGLDASRSMLSRAVDESVPGNVAYVRGDASALPFVDASFDAVCCFAALYLIEEPFRAIDEIVRVTAPGGHIALLSSVNRGLVPASVTNAVVRRASGVRVFGRDEITSALRERGTVQIEQRLSGMAQFVSGTVRPTRL